MESGIPDFKDWHKLDIKREIFLPNGEIFLKLNYYIKYEPVEKIFEGANWVFYGKEILKAWTSPDSSGKKNRTLMALLLEDGSWAVSLPFYEGEQRVSDFFDLVENPSDYSIQLKVLTESGWKSRVIKVM